MIAKRQHCKVMFNFNGCVLIAAPKTSPMTLDWLYTIHTGRAHSKYLSSDGYKEYLRQRLIDVAAKQKIVDQCFNELPLVANDPLLLLRLIQRYTDNADDVDVSAPLEARQQMIATLQGAGYYNSDSVDLPVECYDDLGISVRYIIGQVLDMMEKGYQSPHPVLSGLIDNALKPKSIKHYVVDEELAPPFLDVDPDNRIDTYEPYEHPNRNQVLDHDLQPVRNYNEDRDDR